MLQVRGTVVKWPLFSNYLAYGFTLLHLTHPTHGVLTVLTMAPYSPRLYALWQEAHLRLEVGAAEELSEEAIVSRLMQARYLVITRTSLARRP